MSVFIPLLDNDADPELVASLRRIGPVILPPVLASSNFGFAHYALLDHDATLNVDALVSILDKGAEKVVVPLAWANELVGVLPAERLLVLLDVGNASAVSDRIRSGVSGVLLKTPAADAGLVTSLARFFVGADVHVWITNPSDAPTVSTIRELRTAGAFPVIQTSQLTVEPTTRARLNVADAFLAPLSSDRPDGLFPTIVTEDSRSLGLVYSSATSVRESILTGKGVYQSRKHGLWRKGETSGATQDVVYLRADCDLDALEFEVRQRGAGFCHLNRTSCFGEGRGLAALQRTLLSRLESAPEGSYTRRLFNDPALVRAKIMEEADELCRAETKEEIAFEAADLTYFALARCIAAGVTLADIERSLDQKAKKVTRRPGNAKPQWANGAASSAAPAPAKPAVDNDGPIRMRTYILAETGPKQRALLLKRPVLNSGAMIAKVQPIVQAVRERGDAALLAFVAQFDKCTVLTDTALLRAPFPEPSVEELPLEVKEAINVAYANVKAFHAAQAEGTTLRVETMPGVVCSRFARPIARVGLYVPGGTAILPSTALMLGVPAQVAGCKEVIIATPPRPDGSVSPEVMYVAKLVGASAVLRAGGAQAVAALAYGTDTVPKVDKIFGPGNQWVTAAKMLVQNDTDALVSIDMPAGPSEVLVCVLDNFLRPRWGRKAETSVHRLSQTKRAIPRSSLRTSSLKPSTASTPRSFS